MIHVDRTDGVELVTDRPALGEVVAELDTDGAVTLTDPAVDQIRKYDRLFGLQYAAETLRLEAAERAQNGIPTTHIVRSCDVLEEIIREVQES